MELHGSVLLGAFTGVRPELAMARNTAWHLTGMGSLVTVNRELCATPQDRCQFQNLYRRGVNRDAAPSGVAISR